MNNISSTISYSNLYNKYRSNYFLAFQDLFFHTFILSLTYTFIYYYNNIYFLSIPLTFLLGLLKIKTFIIFHDCGHNSYTPSILINNIIGIITGIFIFNPFSWNFNHNTHHLVSGNLDNKYNYGFNETVFHTLNNYKSWSLLKKTLYKTILHPFIFFFVLAPFKFIIIMRIYAIHLILKKKIC
jgi:omega-6 fatty acid desaturase (delta-12 desaturase)